MNITDKEFLDYENAIGVSYNNPDYVNLMAAVNDIINTLDNNQTILEIGAGIGCLGDIIQKENKKKYFGIDPNKEHIKEAKKHNVKLVKDLTKIKDKDFSVGVSIEVFEHITDKQIEEYLTTFNFNYFLFSSTPFKNVETYNGFETFDQFWGHINIKNETEWITLFDKFGYKLKTKLTIPTSWSLLFEKK